MAEALRRRAEWSFVRFVRGVYAGEAPETWAPDEPLLLETGLAGAGASRPMLDAVAPLIAKGTWKFLAKHGGYRKRNVVVSDRARSGRLWDEPVWGAEPLKITSATIGWLAAAHDAIAGSDAGAVAGAVAGAGAVANEDVGSGSRSVVAINASAIEAGKLELSPGDRLALSGAFTGLFRHPSLAGALATTARPVTARLPAFALAHPRYAPEALTWTLDEGHETTALQYLDHWIAAAWVAEIQRLRARATVAEQVAAFERLSRVIGALFTAATPQVSDHLLTPVVRFFPQLWRDLGGTDGIGASIARGAESLPTRSERETYERSFGGILGHGVALEGRVQTILQTPWPDRTESQKRLASEHENRYRPIRDDVRTLARRLRRDLG